MKTTIGLRTLFSTALSSVRHAVVRCNLIARNKRWWEVGAPDDCFSRSGAGYSRLSRQAWHNS